MPDLHTVIDKQTDKLLSEYCKQNNCTKYKAVRNFTEKALHDEQMDKAKTREEQSAELARQLDENLKRIIADKTVQLKDFTTGEEQSEDTENVSGQYRTTPSNHQNTLKPNGNSAKNSTDKDKSSQPRSSSLKVYA